MVKWISQRSSEPLLWVRVLLGAQRRLFGTRKAELYEVSRPNSEPGSRNFLSGDEENIRDRVLLGAHCKYLKITTKAKVIFFYTVPAGLSFYEGGGGGDFSLNS